MIKAKRGLETALADKFIPRTQTHTHTHTHNKVGGQL